MAYVARLASAKSAAVEAAPDELVIAADTTVDVDSEILGKPADDDEAAGDASSLVGSNASGAHRHRRCVETEWSSSRHARHW